MTKEIYISTTPHETRLAIVEDEQLVEVHYERENEYTLAGAIYNGRVTRVLPGMQSAFVDVGLDRDAFLYVTDFIEEQEDTGEFDRTVLPGQAASRFVRGEQRAEGSEQRADQGRGGERGGEQRGERGRGRGRERSGERGGERSAAPERSQEDLDEVDSLATGSLAPDETRSVGDAGEDAGARRWRGRRGRRRGRGGRERTPGEREPGTNGERGQSMATPSFATPNAGPNAGPSAPMGETIQLHSDDESWGDEPIAPLPPPEPRRSESDGPRRETSRGDRFSDRSGDRSSDRSRRGRDAGPPSGGRERWSERSSERGTERPSSGERSGERSRGPVEPAFVLPGESLSKYGGAGRESAGSQSAGSQSGGSQSGGEGFLDDGFGKQPTVNFD